MVSLIYCFCFFDCDKIYSIVFYIKYNTILTNIRRYKHG